MYVIRQKMALSFTEMVLHKSRRLPSSLHSFFPLNTSTFCVRSTEWVNKKMLHSKKIKLFIEIIKSKLDLCFPNILISSNILSFYFPTVYSFQSRVQKQKCLFSPLTVSLRRLKNGSQRQSTMLPLKSVEEREREKKLKILFFLLSHFQPSLLPYISDLTVVI